jgi:hypothetical protein
MEEQKAITTVDLSFCELLMEEIASNLQQQGILKEEKNRLHGERMEIKAMISNSKKKKCEAEKGGCYVGKKKLKRM